MHRTYDERARGIFGGGNEPWTVVCIMVRGMFVVVVVVDTGMSVVVMVAVVGILAPLVLVMSVVPARQR